MDETSPIEFTQYLLPNRQSTRVTIDRPQAIAVMAGKIRDRGYRFEIEMLSDYRTISMTITDDECDHDIEVVPNGPEVPMAVDRMIERFHAKLMTGAAPQ